MPPPSPVTAVRFWQRGMGPGLLVGYTVQAKQSFCLLGIVVDAALQGGGQTGAVVLSHSRPLAKLIYPKSGRRRRMATATKTGPLDRKDFDSTNKNNHRNGQLFRFLGQRVGLRVAGDG